MIKKGINRLLGCFLGHAAARKTVKDAVVKVGEAASRQRCRLTLSVEAIANTKSQGNELWLLDIEDESGKSIQDWSRNEFPAPWQIPNMDERPALVTSEAASLSLDVPINCRLRLLKHPWSGIVSLQAGGKNKRVDLYSPLSMTTCWSVADVLVDMDEQYTWSEEELAWISATRDRNPAVISVLHPDWRGVRSATTNLVEHHLLVPDDLNEVSATRMAGMICAADCSKVLFGGFPISHALLVKALRQIDPEIRLYVFWLSSFMQSEEEYTWHAFKTLDDLCRQGFIGKWGFAKKGMAEVVGRTGVVTGFIASYVRNIPAGPSKIDPVGVSPHFGLWALAPIWRKNPFAMLAALSEIPGAQVTVTGQDWRVEEFAKYLSLSLNLLQKSVDQNDMPAVLARMDLNLYVTLSECSPMLPLESLAVGVPCLLGPNSHLFEDHPYLHSRLVVPYPDRSDVIVHYIQQALDEREEIIARYREYAVEYNNWARGILLEFLELPDNARV